jgi:hypothetical protein
MAKSIYHGANVETTDTFSQWLTRTNSLSYDMATVVLTAGSVAQPNTTNGAMTTGNTHLQGIMSANTVAVTDALRGGSVSASGNLNIVSNTIFADSGIVTIGANTATFTVNAANSLFTGHLTVNAPTKEVKITANNTSIEAGKFTAKADVQFVGGARTDIDTPVLDVSSANTYFSGNTFEIVSGNIVIGDNGAGDIVTIKTKSTFTANATFNDDVVINDVLTHNGTQATFNNNVILGSNNADRVTLNSYVINSIIPSTNIAYDLGTTALRYRTLLAQDANLTNRVTSKDVLTGDVLASGNTMSIGQGATTAMTIGANSALVSIGHDTNGVTVMKNDASVENNFSVVGNTTLGGSQFDADTTTINMGRTDGVGSINTLSPLNVNKTATFNTLAIFNSSISVGGLASFNGSINLGNDINDGVNINGRVGTHIIPNANAQRDIGSSGLRFNGIWALNANISDTVSSDKISTREFIATSANTNLVNTTSTQINLGGAATTIRVGASTGETRFNHSARVVKDLVVEGNVTILGQTTTTKQDKVESADKVILLNATNSPSDTTADGGGFVVRSNDPAGDKTFLWTNAGGNWFSTENLNLKAGKVYRINGGEVLSNDTLGAGVVNSSLTKVGVLNSGSISSGFGNINIGSSVFTGNGSGLNSLNASNLTTGTISDARIPSFIVRDGTQIIAGDGLLGGGNLSTSRTLSLDSTVVRTSGNQTISGNKTFQNTVTAGAFSGNGAAVVELNASNLSAGTVNDARIPSNIVRNTRRIDAGSGLTGGGDFNANRTLSVDGTVLRTSGNQSISGDLSVTGDMSAGKYVLKGGVHQINNNDGGAFNFRFGNRWDGATHRYTHGGGAALLNVEVDSSTNAPYFNFGLSTNTGAGNGTVVNFATPLTIHNNLVETRVDLQLTGRSLHAVNGFFSNLVRADSLEGSGAAVHSLNASNLTTGTVNDARIPGNIVRDYRSISAGDGLTGGGNFAANRSISVDTTVLRTFGNQSIGGSKTFNDTMTVGGLVTSTAGGVNSFRANGSNAVNIPGYSFTTETNTGMYMAGTNSIGFAVAGVQRARIESSGFIGNGSNITGVNAAKLDGLDYSYSETGTTIAARNGSGDIYARLFRSTYPNYTSIGGGAGILFRNDHGTDNYLKVATGSAVVNYLNAQGGINASTVNDGMYLSNSQTVTGYKTFNGAAISQLNITGSVKGNSGDNTGAPSYSWSGYDNTGMYLASTTSIGFAIAGTQRAVINTTGFSGNGSQLSSVNANKLQGYEPRFDSGPNTIPMRTSSGDIFCRLVRSDFGTSDSIDKNAQVMMRISTTNDYLRPIGAKGFFDYLNDNKLHSNYLTATEIGAWVVINEPDNGGATYVKTSRNVSSVVELEQGVYRINFATSLRTSNPAVIGTARASASTQYASVVQCSSSTNTYCVVQVARGHYKDVFSTSEYTSVLVIA